MARDDLLTYIYFKETFKIHTNASDFKLGTVISQKGKLIAFYTRKITDTQKSYTITEKQPLIIVESLK